MPTISIRISAQEKAEFRRACRLLDRTQSAIIQRAVIRAIRTAREQYGSKFDCASINAEAVLESVEAGMHELSEISAHTALSEAEVTAALKELTHKKLISTRHSSPPIKGPRTHITPLYFLPER